MKAFWPVTSVGLDLGSSQTKAVVVRLALGGARPIQVLWADAVPELDKDLELGLEEALPPLDEQPASAEKISFKKLIRKIKSADVISAGLSARKAFHRFLSLPRLGTDKLRQAALYSLEEHLPRPVDDLRADIVGKVSRNGSEKLVMALDGQAVADALERLQLIGLRLENVSLDAVGLIAAAVAAKAKDDIVVDLGAEKATIICFSAGQPTAIGHSGRAGRALDRQLARDKGIDEDQARRLKEELEDAAQAEAVFAPVLDVLAGDIDRLAKAGYTGAEDPPARLLLSGGASRLPGLAEYLGRKLDLAAEPLKPFRRKLPPEAVIAAGMALSGMDFNLARGMRTNRRASRLLKAVFAVVILVLALGGANLWRLNEERRQALSEIRQTQRQLVKKGLPHLKRVISPIRQTEMELERSKEELAALSRGQSAATMLGTIKSLDAMVDVKKIRLSDMVVDGGRITISGLAETFDSLEKFKADLAEKGGFKEVVLASSKKDGTGVRFQLRMNR